MAVDFPSNRPEANLGTGPLQEGDSWRFNSIEYTWVLSPDGTGMWSSKGINVNPENYIHKVNASDNFNQYSLDVEGTWKSGLKVNKSNNKEIATLDEFGKLSNNVLPTGFEGPPGAAATISVGSTSTGEAGTDAAVTIDPTSTEQNQILHFTIPRGADGQDGIDGTGVRIEGSITEVGPPNNGNLPGGYTPENGDIWIDSTGDGWAYDGATWTNIGDIRGPQGEKGDPGVGTPGTTPNISVGDTTTGEPGTNASVTRRQGSTDAAPVFDFTIPRGDTGAAATVSVGSTSTGAPGTNASVTQGGTAQARIFNFTIPRGEKGEPGTGTEATLQDILNNGATAIENPSLNLTGTITLNNANGQVLLQPSEGCIELTHNTFPYIDFKNRVTDDFDARISCIAGQQRLNITADGGVFVNGSEVTPNQTIFAENTVFWEDYATPGRTDQQAFEAFRDAVDASTSNLNLFVPGGIVITLTAQVDFNRKFGITGPVTALGKAASGIRFFNNSWDINNNTGINARAGMRAVNFKFEGDGNRGQSEAQTTPETLIFLGTNFGGTGSNDPNIDSSFKNCDFGNARDSNLLWFNGRNVNVGGCAFSNCNNCVAIRMSWNNIPVGSDDQQRDFSWRKNRIYDNQFHNRGGGPGLGNISIQIDEAVGAPGSYCAGLIVANNIVDIGCGLLNVENSTQGLCVSGNTWYGRNNEDTSDPAHDPIRFRRGTHEGAVITGNSFGGWSNGSRNPDNFIFVTTGVILNGLTITGNSFSYSVGDAINGNSVDFSRTVIGSNTFIGCGATPFPQINVTASDTNVVIE